MSEIINSRSGGHPSSSATACPSDSVDARDEKMTNFTLACAPILKTCLSKSSSRGFAMIPDEKSDRCAQFA